MSTDNSNQSQPSREVYALDVPKVRSFAAKFVYQYFVPDEATDASSGTSQTLLTKPGEFFNAAVIDYLGSARAPRYVTLTWSPVSIRDVVYGQSAFFQDPPVPKDYIRSNLKKVLSVDHFTSEQYTSVSVTDQSIDRKLFAFVSSSATLLNSQRQMANSQRGLALNTDALTSDQVDFHFLSTYLAQPAEDGVFFYENNSKQILETEAAALKGFAADLQLNNSVVHTLVKRASTFAESTFNSVYNSMFEASSKLQGRAKARGLQDLRANDYRTVAPAHVSLHRVETVNPTLTTRARVVGYIVDRYELSPSGAVKALEPIVVEDPKASSTVDLGVKYYARYQYDVRSVAELKIPSIVEETGELVVATILVASRPSTPVVVQCVDNTPPPPPADTKFTWDYEAEQLNVTWCLPPQPQRDVKQFQVFRRSTTDEPFQLVKQIVFDDSAVLGPYYETPDPRLVQHVDDPVMRFVDDEFTMASDFIYTLGTVDAHGIVSAYGPQSRVRFDRSRNRLRVDRISPAGAPRPYPNMHLRAKPFLESVVESRKFNMTIAFQPEHLDVVDSSGNNLNFLQTDQTGGVYRILAINTDLGTAGTVDVTVVDARTAKDRLEGQKLTTIPDYGDSVAKGSS